MTKKTQKKLRKLLTLVSCAVLLVCVTIGATVAYLTSQDTVVNTFSVGNVKITLDETDVDNSTADADRDQANSYKLMPGHTYTKDPVVHVDAESEDSYLFVKIENEIADIEDDTATIAGQMEEIGWIVVDEENGIYVYEAKVEAGDDITVFETFTVADDVINTALAEYEEAQIVVTAYAVQADGFEEQFENEEYAAIYEAAFGA